MSLLNIELQAILKDGSIKTLALANSAPAPVASTPAQLPLPLSVKAEEGTQYRLIDLTSGTHLKGQRLLRHQKKQPFVLFQIGLYFWEVQNKFF